MSTKINVAGVWKTPTLKINVAGVWKTPSSTKINVAGVWKEVGASAPTVSLSSANVNWLSDFTTYAMVRYSTDGSEYKNATANTSSTTSFRNTWLTSGSASGAYIERTINSGSPWTDSIGASRTQMTSDKTIGERDISSTGSAQTTNLTVRMYDAASGGNLLSSATFSLTANYYNTCPTCCFTPDTPILMASGLQMPIGRVRKGDEIIVFDPRSRKNVVEKVTEIIVRYERAMYAMQFDDGTVLRVSDDHPFHVEEKGGPASINPLYEYKGHGIPQPINIGDLVSRPDGSRATITAIRKIDYTDAVFTFGNSHYYANGKLVY